MSETQFQALFTEIKSIRGDMNTRFDTVELELGEIRKALQRIEGWTPYNANQDIMARLNTLR